MAVRDLLALCAKNSALFPELPNEVLVHKFGSKTDTTRPSDEPHFTPIWNRIARLKFDPGRGLVPLEA